MQNGQLKPGYNAQISTKNQIIVNYTLHQNPTDTKTLKPHLENLKETYGERVFQEMEDITADAGYGSEENYDYLEEQGLTAYVKYNTFDKEQDKNHQKKHKPFSKENLYYNQEEDYYVCPMGKKCIEHTKANVLPKQDIHSIYRITGPRTVEAAPCGANVLKQMEIGA